MKKLSKHIFVFLSGFCILYLQSHHFVRNISDHLYEYGDSFINSWILAWNAHALFRSDISIWDAPIFYPVENALTFSEPMFGNLWITLPIQWITNNPTLASNTLLVMSFILCAYAVYLLVYDITASFWAGLISGILFSFNPYRWGHAGHLQLLPIFWSVLALLFANRFIDKSKPVFLYGMLACTLIQYYASIYLGTMLLTMLIVLFTIHLVFEKKGEKRWFWITQAPIRYHILIGSLLSVLVMMPLGKPYLETAEKYRFGVVSRNLEDNSNNSAEPLSFFLRPSHGFANYRWLKRIMPGKVRGGEGNVFIGLSPWVLAAAVLFFYRRFTDQYKRIIRRYALLMLVMGMLCLGPFLVHLNETTDIAMPYQAVYHLVPGGKAMRAPARFIQLFLLCMTVLGGISVAALLSFCKKWRLTTKLAASTAFFFFLSFDYAVFDNKGVTAETRENFPEVYRYLAGEGKRDPILELPVGRPGRDPFEFKYLHYQSGHWRPSLNGMSGFFPSARWILWDRTKDCPSDDCSSFLGLTPAKTILIHLDKYSEAERDAWLKRDLSGYGFRFINRIGNSLIWERDTRPDYSKRLDVSFVEWNIDRSGINLHLILKAENQSMPWQYLSSDWSDVDINISLKDGKKFSYHRSYIIPSYLTAGERSKSQVRIPKIINSLSQIKTVRIHGSLLNSERMFSFHGDPIFIRSQNGRSVCLETGTNRLMVNEVEDRNRNTFSLIRRDGDRVVFQAANGCYVCAEGGGGKEIVANREAIGEWEVFKIIPVGEEKMAIQSSNGFFVTVVEGYVAASSNKIGKLEAFEFIENKP
jgi:hypothetical protein